APSDDWRGRPDQFCDGRGEALDAEAVAASLRPTAVRGGAIISFQNSVQKDDILRKYIPAKAVMGGVCYIAAAIAEPLWLLAVSIGGNHRWRARRARAGGQLTIEFCLG